MRQRHGPGGHSLKSEHSKSKVFWLKVMRAPVVTSVAATFANGPPRLRRSPKVAPSNRIWS